MKRIQVAAKLLKLFRDLPSSRHTEFPPANLQSSDQKNELDKSHFALGFWKLERDRSSIKNGHRKDRYEMEGGQNYDIARSHTKVWWDRGDRRSRSCLQDMDCG